MLDIAGFPGFEVQFTKEGAVHGQAEAAALLDFLAHGTVSDLFVFAHGWNNDMAEARSLNQNFFARVAAVRRTMTAAAERRFAVLCVLWPSKKFAEKDLIPSGVASLDATETLYLQDQLDDLKGLFQDAAANKKLDRAKTLVPQLEASPAARIEFADLLRSLLPKPQAVSEDAADLLCSISGEQLFQELKDPVLAAPAPAPAGEGGVAAISDISFASEGGAASVGTMLRDVGAGVAGLAGRVVNVADTFANRMIAAGSNLANLTTYYEMKARAGTVGVLGVNPLLRRVREQAPNPKLHLIGHSFGGRLVTAATLGQDGMAPLRPNSLTLLQAAFSHNGFGRRFDGVSDGFFRRVVTDQRVTGPILISCSDKDFAVGLAYPLASRLARQAASGLGGPDDRYGGIGRNGARHTPEAIDGFLLPAGSSYAFQPGSLYNLNGNAIIGGHSDICKDEVAYALLTAVEKT